MDTKTTSNNEPRDDEETQALKDRAVQVLSEDELAAAEVQNYWSDEEFCDQVRQLCDGTEELAALRHQLELLKRQEQNLQFQISIVKELAPYVDAMRAASGISPFDAWLCVLYALATHFMEQLDFMPALMLIGPTGTGKSTALAQMKHMCKAPKFLAGETRATLRDEVPLNGTALIDEGDYIREELLRKRTDRQQSGVRKNVARGDGGWNEHDMDLFGASIAAKRRPLKAEDLRNRSIVIRTADDGLDPSKRHYRVTSTPSLESVAQKITLPELPAGSGRVMDTWSILIRLATAVGLHWWLDEAEEVMTREIHSHRSNQGYEPRAAVLAALDALTWDEKNVKYTSKSVKLSEVTSFLEKEFVMKLKPSQIQDIVQNDLRFETGITHGYPTVKVDVTKLEQLLG